MITSTRTSYFELRQAYICCSSCGQTLSPCWIIGQGLTLICGERAGDDASRQIVANASTITRRQSRILRYVAYIIKRHRPLCRPSFSIIPRLLAFYRRRHVLVAFVGLCDGTTWQLVKRRSRYDCDTSLLRESARTIPVRVYVLAYDSCSAKEL